MERPWPLTGRDEALRTAAVALRPGAAGIVVAGPAGVGKTRLAREAVALRTPREARLLWVQGTVAARALPLGAFAGVVDGTGGDAATTIGRSLESLARQGPVVLVVDDAHLLDEHSAILLHRVVLRGLAPVLVTVRSGRAGRSGQSGPSGLSGQVPPDAVSALWKDDHLARLELEPLDAAESTALVASVLGGAVESASARHLWRLSEGLPLFLRHLVAGEVAAGRLSREVGVWRWTQQPALTDELVALLGAELDRLDAGARGVLDLVAVAEPLPLDSLTALASPADVEEAERRGLVRLDGTLVRLAHPLYGEVRRASMGTLTARRLRGQVATTLDPAGGLLSRAVLTLDSDLPPDPGLFLMAAQEATRLWDLPLAERLARAAAATGAPEARLVHAATLSWLSRGDEAETILAGIAAETTSAPMRAMAHLHRAGNLLFTLARVDDARRALAEARDAGAYPLHVEGMSLVLAVVDGDIRTVLVRGPALLRADLPDELAKILAASAVSAAAAATCGRALLDEAATVGGLTGERVPTTIPGFGLADLQVLGHRLTGTPALGAARARRIRSASADLPGPARLMGLVVAGHAALAEGLLHDALLVLREAWAGLAGSDHEFRFRCRTLLVTAAAQAGQFGADDAPSYAGQGDSHPAYRLHGPEDLLARAWSAAAEGATSRAVERAASAAHLARSEGAPGYEVLAWQTAVQLGESGAALARLSDLADLCPRARVARDHASAWEEQDGDALVVAARSWARLGDLVAAGDAAAQAAQVHRRLGRHGSALSAAALATRLSHRSGARTPAMRAALRPLPLTSREREIVTLAGRGLSNRAIAERLTLSVRTVEGHVYRAGLKLGISQRSALADVLGDE